MRENISYDSNSVPLEPIMGRYLWRIGPSSTPYRQDDRVSL